VQKSPPRLGFVIYGSPDQLSGGYVYDRALASALRKEGWEVEWISMDPEDSPSKVAHSLQGLWDILLYDELCHDVLASEEVVLPHGPKHVGLVHHFRYQEDWSPEIRQQIRQAEEVFCRKMEAFVVNSQHTSRQVRDLLESHGSGPQFLAYPSGNLWPRGKALPAKDTDSLRIFFLGNLISRKGVHRLLEALALVDQVFQGSWECRIGGSAMDQAYREALQDQRQRLGLKGQVHFLGKLTGPELEEAWDWTNLFCLPSQMEGFGMVFLEAASRGIPVIGPKTGGVPEIIENGLNGYLLEENSPQEIAGLILGIAQDQNLWKQLQAGSINKAGEFGSWEETFAGLGEFLLALKA
jgi:glycosyltransferase involved in cell wall biosynthesis